MTIPNRRQFIKASAATAAIAATTQTANAETNPDPKVEKLRIGCCRLRCLLGARRSGRESH